MIKSNINQKVKPDGFHWPSSISGELKSLQSQSAEWQHPQNESFLSIQISLDFFKQKPYICFLISHL